MKTLAPNISQDSISTKGVRPDQDGDDRHGAEPQNRKAAIHIAPVFSWLTFTGHPSARPNPGPSGLKGAADGEGGIYHHEHDQQENACGVVHAL